MVLHPWVATAAENLSLANLIDPCDSEFPHQSKKKRGTRAKEVFRAKCIYSAEPSFIAPHCILSVRVPSAVKPITDKPHF
jgi:hypothetical protein